MVELAFSTSVPSVAGSQSTLHGRPLTSPRRAVRTTSSIRARRTRGPIIASLSSVVETISRRGLINNVITSGFICAALYVLFTPVKSMGKPVTAAAATADGEMRKPSEGKVTSKVFFDVSIGGSPAGKIVIGKLRSYRSVCLCVDEMRTDFEQICIHLAQVFSATTSRLR